jgi:hypothetical protein
VSCQTNRFSHDHLLFEEPKDGLSPATLNDALNAFFDSSEQGGFEEHFIAALWIDDFFQGDRFPPFFSLDRDTPLPSSFALPCPVCLRFAVLAPPPRVNTAA